MVVNTMVISSWLWIRNSIVCLFVFTIFLLQLPELALAGFRAIAVDLKGFGESSKPTGKKIMFDCP